MRECCGSVERIKAGGRAEAFSHRPRRNLSVGEGGLQGKVELTEARDTTEVV